MVSAAIVATATTGQYSDPRNRTRSGSQPSMRVGPTSTSGMMTTPNTRAVRYSENDSARVRTIPRMPLWPYMIAMVSTKTLRALDPDHSASRNPSETSSNRPPRNTSATVGRSTSVMLSSVRNCAAYSRIDAVTWSTVVRPTSCPT